MKTTLVFGPKQAPAALTDRLESGIMPLINLVFLLLMFFLIAGVITQAQLPQLPANPAASTEREPRVDFTIEGAGQLLHQGQPLALEDLPALLQATAAQEGSAQPYLWRIGADENLAMADLERILVAFDGAAIGQVQLLTEPTP